MTADVFVSVGLLGLLGVASVAYCGRLALAGRARAARLDKDGGSPFLSVPVMELGYWVLRPVLTSLDRIGATANGVTLFALVPGVAAAVAASQGWFGVACLLGMSAALCDALDGMLAQRKGGSTRGGQALDSILDRVTESALFVGIALYFHESQLLLTLCLLALVGAYLTSYVSAKAEAMNVELPRGVMRRAERAVYTLTACSIAPLWALWVPLESPTWLRGLPVLAAVTLVGAMSNISAALRLSTLLEKLSPQPAGSAASTTAVSTVSRRPNTQEFDAEYDSIASLQAGSSGDSLAGARANSRGVA